MNKQEKTKHSSVVLTNETVQERQEQGVSLYKLYPGYLEPSVSQAILAVSQEDLDNGAV